MSGIERGKRNPSLDAIELWRRRSACQWSNCSRASKNYVREAATTGDNLREERMNIGQRQIIAEKVASTIRVLELLGFEYQVSRARKERKKRNSSPRVVNVYAGGESRPENLRLRIYNNAEGYTWANTADGSPVKEVGSVEELYGYLSSHPGLKLRIKSKR
jgi:hypothetical protein